MDKWQEAVSVLPERLKRSAAERADERTEEIRLRAGRRPTLLSNGIETEFSSEPVRQEELERVLERATGASLHTAVSALRDGYLSYRGLRIGLCGEVYGENGCAEGFRSLSSLAIRIPHECPGLCDRLIGQMYPLSFQSTIILSPPGGGKTTALRELIRGLSERGRRIGVVDERNELSASQDGQAWFDLGSHTDVMVGLSKASAGMMLLRSMNPEIIAVDEISAEKDLDAVEQICGCGVGLLATLHASGRDELNARPRFRRLLESAQFVYALTIRQCGSRRSYHAERLAE